jgi:hypothetical protein
VCSTAASVGTHSSCDVAYWQIDDAEIVLCWCDQDWISAETLGDGKSGPCVGPVVHSMGLPSQQWNGMLKPLLNTTIKGAIWYQGESNHGQNELYSCRYHPTSENQLSDH